MNTIKICRHLTGLGIALLLSACASAPPLQSLALVAVQRTVTPTDLAADHSQAIKTREALRRANVDDALVASGRVVRVACATMSDGTWGGLAILPAGQRANQDSVWRLQVMDVGDNDRDPVNPLVEPLPDVQHSGQAAYRFVPNWRELGRSTNIDPIPLPAEQRGRYHVVFSRYLVRCKG